MLDHNFSLFYKIDDFLIWSDKNWWLNSSRQWLFLFPGLKLSSVDPDLTERQNAHKIQNLLKQAFMEDNFNCPQS